MNSPILSESGNVSAKAAVGSPPQANLLQNLATNEPSEQPGGVAALLDAAAGAILPGLA
jgi:hypothetical protein